MRARLGPIDSERLRVLRGMARDARAAARRAMYYGDWTAADRHNGLREGLLRCALMIRGRVPATPICP